MKVPAIRFKSASYSSKTEETFLAGQNRDEVKSKIKNLIESELNIKIKDDDQDLIGTDTIDSYTMMLLISFISREYQVQLDMEKIDFDAFGSLNTITELVTKQHTAK
jgi:acyl carrier protein